MLDTVLSVYLELYIFNILYLISYKKQSLQITKMVYIFFVKYLRIIDIVIVKKNSFHIQLFLECMQQNRCINIVKTKSQVCTHFYFVYISMIFKQTGIICTQSECISLLLKFTCQTRLLKKVIAIIIKNNNLCNS